ncbi:MAG TPA: anthranilate synthase component I, partial [Pseudolabrys sp.]
MQIEPLESAFADTYGRGQAQVVWTTLVADLETPVSAFLKVARRPPGFLLESVEGGAQRGRYSMIGLDPDLIWRARDAKAEINRTPRSKPDAFTPCPDPPLKALRALIAESRIELPDGLPPMAAGVFGYLGYDMVRQMEKLPAPNPDPIGIPDAVMVRPTIIVVFDAVKDSITVVTPVRPE